MDPVEHTPTEPMDYAVLTAAYGSLLGALLLARRARGDQIEPRELPGLGAATFALSKTIAHEKVETWMRRPFVEEVGGRSRPRGSGLRYALGELLSCSRCLGAWSALGLVGLRTFSPRGGRTVTAVLASSAANDFLQAGFTWLCGRANAAPRP